MLAKLGEASEKDKGFFEQFSKASPYLSLRFI
jgi:hypothetical protein